MKALKQSGRVFNFVGERRYPQQRERLDELRDGDYALVVFDALRYDVARDVLPQYLKGDVEPIWSAAHDTFQYGQRCWSERAYDATYVAGATPFHADPDFEKEHFQELYGDWNPGETIPNLVEAWRDCWDRSLGTVNPEQLTQTALGYTGRDELVAHYFQPHAPYIGRYSMLGHTNNKDAGATKGEPVDKPLWDRVKSGKVSSAELRRAYLSNLHRGIEASLPLIRELCDQDRRVVVMADHGELLGEWHPNLVSHPRISLPQIRTVPWMEVQGVREFAGVDAVYDGGEKSTEEKLEALGYMG